MALLNVYTSILDGCKSKAVNNFIITRIYKILSKEFGERKDTDFPQTPYDLQVVNLVAYLKDGKLPYAFLYASSLHATIKQNHPKMAYKRSKGTHGIWSSIRRLFTNKQRRT